MAQRSCFDYQCNSKVNVSECALAQYADSRISTRIIESRVLIGTCQDLNEKLSALSKIYQVGILEADPEWKTKFEEES